MTNRAVDDRATPLPAGTDAPGFGAELLGVSVDGVWSHLAFVATVSERFRAHVPKPRTEELAS